MKNTNTYSPDKIITVGCCLCGGPVDVHELHARSADATCEDCIDELYADGMENYDRQNGEQ